MQGKGNAVSLATRCTFWIGESGTGPVDEGMDHQRGILCCERGAESQLSASQPALSIVCVSIPAGADLTAPVLRRAVLGKLDWRLYGVVDVTVQRRRGALYHRINVQLWHGSTPIQCIARDKRELSGLRGSIARIPSIQSTA